MLRRSVGAALVLFVLGSFVLAETYQGVITKIDDNKATIRVGGNRKKGEKGKEVTVKITKDTKITRQGRGKGSEPTTISSTDLRIAVSVVGAVGARVETKGEGDNEEATEIKIGGGGRGKGGKGGKKKNKTDE